MKGILEEKSEIEKLQVEYQMMSKINFNSSKFVVLEDELILEDCEL
jgi:hypothetical protein